MGKFKENNIIRNEQGSAMFTSLLTVTIMNLLVIGLAQTSSFEYKMATYQSIDAEVFHLSESCNEQAVKWLREQTSPSEDLPTSIEAENIDYMLTGEETQSEINKLSGYSYNCTIEDITAKSLPKSESQKTGVEIADNGGYGLSGELSPVYYYQVTSNAQGPQNSSKNTYTIMAVEY